MRRILIVASLAVVVALATGWWLVSRMGPRSSAVPPAADSPGQPDAQRKIRASLFYVAEDGLRLVAVDREVPFGDDTATQARLLVEEQLKPAPAPLVQAVPDGTTLRGVFLAENGAAFVDLSKEASTRHIGGSLDELFSVYAIVNVLTVNLPAITRVQILVDGKEVDTLAGHIDLREPLQKSLKWVTSPGTALASPASPPAGLAVPPGP